MFHVRNEGVSFNRIIVHWWVVIVHRGWLQNKHVETLHYRLGILEDRSLDDDRSGGRVDGMEWFGEGEGWAGDGEWEGEGRGEGEGSGNRSIFDCSNMMTVLFVHCAKQACFGKAYYRPFVGCDCSPMLVDGIVRSLNETIVFR